MKTFRRIFPYLNSCLMAILIMSLVLAPAVSVQAQSTPNGAASDAAATVSFLYNSDYHGKTYISGDFLSVHKLDGVSTFGVQPIANPLPGHKDLPNWLSDRQWKVLQNDYYNKFEIPLAGIERSKSWWSGSDSMATEFDPRVVVGPDGKIKVLDYYPTDVEPVSIGLAFPKSEKRLPWSARAESVWRAAHATDKIPKFYTILYEVVPVSKVVNIGTGGGGATSTAFNGNDMKPNNWGAAGMMTGAIGMAESWIWDGGPFIAIGWADKGTPPPDPNAAKAVPAGQEPKTPEKVVEKPAVRLDPRLTANYFDLNKFVIRKDEEARIEANADILNETLDKLGPNEKIWFMGGACELGTFELNNELSINRAKAIAMRTANVLHVKHKRSIQFLQEKLRFAGFGEYFPVAQSNMIKNKAEWLEKSRRVFPMICETPAL